MSRYDGTIIMGSVPYAGGASNSVHDFLAFLMSTLGSLQSAGNPAWVITQTSASPITYTAVSRGDLNLGGGNGDADIRLTFTMSGANTCLITAHQNGASSGAASMSLNSIQNIGYTIRYNEYECSLVTIVGAAHRFTSFGSPVRAHIPASAAGVCFTTGAVSAGVGVVVPVDRDCTQTIRVGQFVWVFASTGDVLEVATVTAVTSSTITLTLTGAHPAGAIVGLDPSPVYALSAATGAPPTAVFPNNINGVAAITNGGCDPRRTAVVEAESDPSPTGYYVGLQATLFVPNGFRGIVQHAVFWPIGTQNDGDLMRDNYDDAQRYHVYPSYNITGGFCVSIGPGA